MINILKVYCSYLFFLCAHLEKGNCTFPQAAPSLSVEVKERKVKHFCSWCGGDWLIVVTH